MLKRTLAVLIFSFILVLSSCAEDECEHSFGAWGEVTGVSCTTDGKQTRRCECGYTEERVIPATGAHLFGEWVTLNDATCVDVGTAERKCACGKTESKEISATGVHIFGF